MSRRPVPVLRLMLLFAVPLVAIAGAGWWWLSGGRYVTTDNAYVKAHIVQISPEVSGQVRRVLTRDHATVASGQTLVTIESRPFRLALDSADAELDAARAHVESLRGIWREAVAELSEAGVPGGLSGKAVAAAGGVGIKGVASASKRDEAFNEARGAADRARTAREKLQRVLTALNGDPQLPADQHPMVREKIAARERAALDLARTAVRAPVDGVVVNMRLQQGEQIKAATPLFALVVLSRPWVEANFKETELTHVRVGQKATVVLDTYPNVTWEALVESVSPATGAEFAILPPQNASGTGRHRGNLRRKLNGLRLLDLRLPLAFASAYSGPKFGVAGTRKLTGVNDRPLIGTTSSSPCIGMKVVRWRRRALVGATLR